MRWEDRSRIGLLDSGHVGAGCWRLHRARSSGRPLGFPDSSSSSSIASHFMNCADFIHTELQHNQRIHDRARPDQNQQSNRAQARQPAKNCKGHSASHWNGYSPQYTQASGDPLQGSIERAETPKRCFEPGRHRESLRQLGLRTLIVQRPRHVTVYTHLDAYAPQEGPSKQQMSEHFHQSAFTRSGGIKILSVPSKILVFRSFAIFCHFSGNSSAAHSLKSFWSCGSGSALCMRARLDQGQLWGTQTQTVGKWLGRLTISGMAPRHTPQNAVATYVRRRPASPVRQA